MLNNLSALPVKAVLFDQDDTLFDHLYSTRQGLLAVCQAYPFIFHVALERIGCRADEVVMIGDSWKSDILGASQAGIRAIWLNRTASACPDPALALELASLELLEIALDAILAGQRADRGGL